MRHAQCLQGRRQERLPSAGYAGVTMVNCGSPATSEEKAPF